MASRKRRGTALLVGAFLVVTTASVPAQEKAPAATAAPSPIAPASPRPAGYDKLQMFVGRWTIEGREDRYLEQCDWFDGRFTVVCNTESKRRDGAVTRSMSVLGYLPEEDVYTYHGFNSNGRNETQRGGFKGTTFWVEGEARDGGKQVKSRVTITPKSDGGFTLVGERSTEGAPWVTDGTFQYQRVR